jgi:spore germination protein GerM
LYYYNPEKDKDIGGRILCSKQGLVPVEREIVKTKTPITDTIRLLLQGKLTAEEEKAGLETEFPLYRLTLTSTKLENGQLTLNFNDPGDETRGGGACRVNVLRAQVLQTAKQFSGVKQVAIAPDAVFKP